MTVLHNYNLNLRYDKNKKISDCCIVLVISHTVVMFTASCKNKQLVIVTVASVALLVAASTSSHSPSCTCGRMVKHQLQVREYVGSHSAGDSFF